jgi:hypothetical protein
VVTALGGVAAALALQVQQRGSVALHSAHARVGVAALVFLAAQPLFALRRPPPERRAGWTRRRVWALAHRGGAAAAAALGTAALYTGLDESCGRGLANCADLRLALAAWIAIPAAYLLAREAASWARSANARRRSAAAAAAAAARKEAGVDAERGGLVEGEHDGVPSGSLAMIAPAEPAASSSAGGGDLTDEQWERGWAWAAMVCVAVAVIITAVIAAGLAGTSGGTAAGVTSSNCSGATAAAAPSSAGTAGAPPGPSGSGAAAAAGLPQCALALALEVARLGDGWCDGGAPYNTAACGYDGGDCCPFPNGTARAAIVDCQVPPAPRAIRLCLAVSCLARRPYTHTAPREDPHPRACK